MKIRTFICLGLAAGACLLALPGCYSVPVTGRMALVMVSQDSELQLGLQSFQEAKTTTPVSRDAALQTRIEMVGRRIAAVSAFPDWKWEFVAFDDPKTPNAWCLPGGKIGVYSGLMPYAKTDGELATVMAHEVGHAVARHGAERMTEQMALAVGAEAVGRSVSQENVERAKVAYGIGSQLFVALPHSRKDELEADRIGLIYMARAGYDPHEALAFWNRFSQISADQPKFEWLSTHPLDDVRIKQINAYMPDAVKEYEAQKAK